LIAAERFTDADTWEADMSERIYRVLFVCRDNAARSIMAEAILNQRGHGRFEAFSAGSHPAGRVHPSALKQLQDARLQTEGLRSKSWDEFAQPGSPPLDFVFTLCDVSARESHPAWPGKPLQASWGVPDPVTVQGSERNVAKAFHDSFMALDWRIGLFISLPIASLDRLTLADRVAEIGEEV
jgi:arsenate reductase